ncbi:MAG: phosphatidate cytidylyltransferase [Bdellovibrionota bacterium]|nr:phosphatidate cytidylyltransferase [Pseudobdellovibrionaceae bacterium]|tara:strand:- start:7424 stop:8347 length:924 start_codon:yes stop_codon:yes gene_type:complete
MLDTPTWNDEIFRGSLVYVAVFMAIIGACVFPFRNKNLQAKATWASWISWMIALPILFILLALEGSWPLAGFVFLSILGISEFFRITGIYSHYWYLWFTYGAAVATGLCIHYNLAYLYNLMPMILLFCLSIIPIFQNEYKRMLQLISLSIIAYILIAWSFLHLGWLVRWENGARQLLLIILLTEICDALNLAFSKLYGKTKWFANIAPRRNVEGFALSCLITLALAFGLRHLLPERTEIYWLSAGLAASLVGGMGDIVLSGIRRDIQVKDRNAFIIGRSGVLDRLDRLIFVAPLYYYILKTFEYYSI